MNGNNTIEHDNATAIVLHIANRIRVFSGVLAMALGMLVFWGWFGWNMNSYLGSIHTPSAPISVSATGAKAGE